MDGPKRRIYLDTSVPRALFDEDKPDRPDLKYMKETTWRFWERCKMGEYEIFISPVLVSEIAQAPEEIQESVIAEMGKIQIHALPGSDEAEKLAMEYIAKAIGEAQENDRRHLAYATVYECGTLVSWNFNHIVRKKTYSGAREVNMNNRYKVITVESPDILMGERIVPWLPPAK